MAHPTTLQTETSTQTTAAPGTYGDERDDCDACNDFAPSLCPEHGTR